MEMKMTLERLGGNKNWMFCMPCRPSQLRELFGSSKQWCTCTPIKKKKEMWPKSFPKPGGKERVGLRVIDARIWNSVGMFWMHYFSAFMMQKEACGNMKLFGVMNKIILMLAAARCLTNWKLWITFLPAVAKPNPGSVFAFCCLS